MGNNQTQTPWMTATAGQLSPNDATVSFLQSINMLPSNAVAVSMPNSLEEGKNSLNMYGTWNGPMTGAMSRIPLKNVPVWDQEKEINAKQKVAWYISDAQSRGQTVEPVKVPVYDPQYPSGANPVDLERYLRWENMVDTQHKYPVYNAGIIDHNAGFDARGMVDKLKQFGNNVKERLTMDMNQMNQGQVMGQQVQGQPVQQAPQQQVQQPIQQQAQAQQPAQQGQQQGEKMPLTAQAVQMAANHPVVATALVAAGGVLVWESGKWVWKKTIGGDPDFSEEEAEALVSGLQVIKENILG